MASMRENGRYVIYLCMYIGILCLLEYDTRQASELLRSMGNNLSFNDEGGPRSQVQTSKVHCYIDYSRKTITFI